METGAPISCSGGFGGSDNKHPLHNRCKPSGLLVHTSSIRSITPNSVGGRFDNDRQQKATRRWPVESIESEDFPHIDNWLEVGRDLNIARAVLSCLRKS